jgi:hypothetical protein
MFGRSRLAKRSAEELVLRQFGFERVHMPPRSPRPTLAEAHGRCGDCLVEVTARGKARARCMCALVDGALRDVRDHRTYRWQGPANGRWRCGSGKPKPSGCGAEFLIAGRRRGPFQPATDTDSGYMQSAAEEQPPRTYPLVPAADSTSITWAPAASANRSAVPG